MSIYQTGRWKAKRKYILRRDGFLCQHFKRYGKNVDANTVHHIYPLGQYPQYAFANWNLISLSRKAHDLMHNRQTDELTELGESLKKNHTPPLFDEKK